MSNDKGHGSIASENEFVLALALSGYIGMEAFDWAVCELDRIRKKKIMETNNHSPTTESCDSKKKNSTTDERSMILSSFTFSDSTKMQPKKVREKDIQTTPNSLPPPLISTSPSWIDAYFDVLIMKEKLDRARREMLAICSARQTTLLRPKIKKNNSSDNDNDCNNYRKYYDRSKKTLISLKNDHINFLYRKYQRQIQQFHNCLFTKEAFWESPFHMILPYLGVLEQPKDIDNRRCPIIYQTSIRPHGWRQWPIESKRQTQWYVWWKDDDNDDGLVMKKKKKKTARTK